MAFATVVCDGIYTQEEIEQLIKGIDKKGGIFGIDDLLNVKISKTYTVSVKYEDSKSKFYFSPNPGTNKVTVAVIKGYNPGWFNTEWSELDPQTESYFYTELENISNFVYVFREMVNNKTKVKQELLNAGLIVKQDKTEQAEDTELTIPPEIDETKKTNLKTFDLSEIFTNPMLILGIVALIVILFLFKK